MPVSAGRLRDRVMIQRGDRVRQGTGWVTNWSDVQEVRAEIVPINGGEAFKQGIERQTQFYRITIRWRADVTPNNRLIWLDGSPDGVKLDIRTCGDPETRRQKLVITAESGVPT